MYSLYVLIISKRQELAFKYKKILKLLNAKTIIVDNLSDAIGEIRKKDFEFIIISDTVKGSTKDFIKQVRMLSYQYRPTIIAISKSAELSDKLELLDAGADDFLTESMPNSEFQSRINAHIRRHIENLTNPLTGFLNENLTRKALKQLIEEGTSTGIILISIENIDSYREIYGEIATQKVLGTIGAIISSTLEKEDISGHIDPYRFLIFTNPLKSEKLAEFYGFAFDNIIKKFYSEFDYKNNFMMFANNSKEEKKVSLMKLSGVVAQCQKGRFKHESELLHTLFNLLKLAKKCEKSSFIVERPRLNGKVDDIPIKKILIMEKDEALSLLIDTTCTIKGYNTLICPDYKEYEESLIEFAPDLVLLDYGTEQEQQGYSAMEITKKAVNEHKCPMPIVIFSTNVLDKKKILSCGADFYLPKPYDINTLIKTIDDFLI